MQWGQRCREVVGNEENEGRRRKDSWGEGTWGGTVSTVWRNNRKWEGKKPLYIVKFNFWEEGENGCLLRHLSRGNVYSWFNSQNEVSVGVNRLGRRWAWWSVDGSVCIRQIMVAHKWRWCSRPMNFDFSHPDGTLVPSQSIPLSQSLFLRWLVLLGVFSLAMEKVNLTGSLMTRFNVVWMLCWVVDLCEVKLLAC